VKADVLLAQERLRLEELGRLGVVELSEDVDPLEALGEQPREASVNVVVVRMQIGNPANTQPFFDDHGNPYTHPVRELYHLERGRRSKLAEVCLEAGLDEWRVRATERDADVLGKALRGDVAG
jgi:hypothetical protein